MTATQDFWWEFPALLAQLYPLGPWEEHVWQRAGGDSSRLPTGVTARDAWYAAVDLVHRGGGGVTLESLLREVMDDFPVNAGIHALVARHPPTADDASGDLTFSVLRLTRPGLLRHVADRLFPRAHRFLTRIGTLDEPHELGKITAYLRELRAELQHEISSHIYIPPVAKRISRKDTAEIEKEAPDEPFILPVNWAIRQIVGPSSGGDSATAQIAVLNRKSKSIRNIVKLLLKRTTRPLVLLGDPGSGKTLTLQQAVVALATAEERRVFPRVPVYVRLGEFHVQGRAPTVGDVRKLVTATLPAPLRDWLPELEREQRIVVFFDGMDEMSRDGYGAHILALSEYAGTYDGTPPSPTLFSCRIADFSPKFIHQRLVILPFGPSQVTAYLRSFVQAPQMVIDRTEWSQAKLARHIIRGGLAVEATNPFVLWLLCLYLQHRHTWPGSRVALLRYFHEQNYDRKIGERGDDNLPFPPRDQAFAAWSRFAYLITERNRGPGIPFALLRDEGDPAGSDEALRAGKRCGVLKESRNGEEYLVRFTHQRFQEYFAACYIQAERPSVDWLGKLDAPRWQETMLNLVLMGQAMDVLTLFGQAVNDQLRECRAALERASAGRETAAAATAGTVGTDEAPTLPEEMETALADRIELSSRIMHQMGAGSPLVREALMPSFTEGVTLLASHGTPITQVKMLRACLNVPGNFKEALEKPLGSKVHWVRDQALILMASGQATGGEIGSDFATEIGFDFANGAIPARLGAYWRAARAAGDARSWWAAAAGAGFYLANLAALTALAVGIFLRLPRVGKALGLSSPDLSVLAGPAGRGAAALLFVAAVGAMTRLNPRRIWFAILATPLAAAVIVPTVATLSSGSWDDVLTLLVLVVVGFGAFGAGALAASPLHLAFLGAYLAATSRLRESNRAPRVFVALAWRSCGYESGFR
ncbi:MAG: NACHT domain-containing protein, partial [Gemmatimonadetes bacterium]|nr:NACHT domain-containing protein [Gemmatimonadota bacterium]